MRMVLLTGIFGGYDVPKPLSFGHGFDDALLVTDDPNIESLGWRTHVVETDQPPRLAAKQPKMNPFQFIEADAYVWIDGAFQVTSPMFREFCETALGENDLVVWEHPHRWHRNCAFAEAEFSATLPKYQNQAISLLEQATAYRTEGMPANYGLWACGSIVWRNVPKMHEFGAAWLAEIDRWGIQDQVSFPYLVWKLHPRLGVFPAHEMHNPYLQWFHHTDGT